MRARFETKGRQPVTVILVTVGEAYVQCAKALLRSELWREGDRSDQLPSPGDLIAEGSAGRHGGTAYDDAYEARVQDQMW